jgi:5-formyltetrahydrofolate cyclo-ligase
MGTKHDIRKRMEHLRKTLLPSEHKANSERICRTTAQLFSHSNQDHHGPCKVFIYLPFRTEIDLMPLIHFCWDRKYEVYAPRVDKSTQQLELYRIRSEADLEIGTWGIREPKLTSPLFPVESWRNLDWILVPGLAFDEGGGRMGYGGGYYDRFMERMAQQASENGERQPRRVALAFEFQLLDTVPMEDHDFRVDYIITEEQTFYIDHK